MEKHFGEQSELIIDENYKLKAVHIQRGWFEIDDCDDLKVVESQLR